MERGGGGNGVVEFTKIPAVSPFCFRKQLISQMATWPVGMMLSPYIWADVGFMFLWGDFGMRAVLFAMHLVNPASAPPLESSG